MTEWTLLNLGTHLNSWDPIARVGAVASRKYEGRGISNFSCGAWGWGRVEKGKLCSTTTFTSAYNCNLYQNVEPIDRMGNTAKMSPLH